MTTNTATTKQTATVALYLYHKGLTAEQTIPWFSTKSYKLKGITYNATQVKSAIATITLLNSNIMTGTAKATKKHGITRT